MDELLSKLIQNVYYCADPNLDLSDEEILKHIDEVLSNYSQEKMLPLEQREIYRTQIFNAMKRFDVLQELLEDSEITEIMINGPENIFIEKKGKIYKSDKTFQSREKLEDIAQKIAGRANRIVNETIPIVDTRLFDGSRVNIVLSPIAIEGPVITIRKFYKEPMTIYRLLELNSITEEVVAFLKNMVEARYNIFISGGTGSGKTTFLNILSNFIPPDERVITIEDSAELQIKNIPNLVRMESRNANLEGENSISIRELIKCSLRMRPDRIIIGEVRGQEALDMLQAMNTGHDGSISTGHSNSTKDMITRLETMVLMGIELPVNAIRAQIASAIDIIIHLGRLRDKTRRVLEIVEISECRDGNIILNPLYKFQESGEDENGMVQGRLLSCGNALVHDEKLKSSGIGKI